MNASFLRIPTLLAGLLVAGSTFAGGITPLWEIPARFADANPSGLVRDVTPRVAEVYWTDIRFIHGLDGGSAPTRTDVAQCPAQDLWRGEALLANLSTPIQFDATGPEVQLAGAACPVGSQS